MTSKEFMTAYTRLEFKYLDEYQAAMDKNERIENRVDRVNNFIGSAPFVYILITFISMILLVSFSRSVSPTTEQEIKFASTILTVLLIAMCSGITFAIIHFMIFTCPIWQLIDIPNWLKVENPEHILDRYEYSFGQAVEQLINSSFDPDKIKKIKYIACSKYVIHDYIKDFYVVRSKVKEVFDELNKEEEL